MENSGMNYFVELNSINVNDNTEKKNGLTYLSWAWAWAELKKMFPLSFYTVYENTYGWNYFTDGKTAWVKTGVTVVQEIVHDGDFKNRERVEIEHIEYLPVMDFRNKSIPAENITSFDVNKAIQRSLTKAVARHGLGLYIYAGEDMPEDEAKETKAKLEKEAEEIKETLADDKDKKILTEMCDKAGVSKDTLAKAVGMKNPMTKAKFYEAVNYLKKMEKK